MKNRISALRAEHDKMKQADLAAIINVSPAALSGYETGKFEAPLETYKAIADFFGVTLDYLLCRSDEPSASPALPQEAAREVLAGEGVRILLDADANLTDDQLSEIVEFIKFKRRTENR